MRKDRRTFGDACLLVIGSLAVVVALTAAVTLTYYECAPPAVERITVEVYVDAAVRVPRGWTVQVDTHEPVIGIHGEGD